MRPVATNGPELDDFVGAKVYCPCALADGNWHIYTKESRLEFATVLSPTGVDKGGPDPPPIAGQKRIFLLK